MKRLQIIVLLAFVGLAYRATGAPAVLYTVELDMTNVIADRMHVRVDTPPVSGDTAIYAMPVTAPGTYSRYDYGRLALDFKAFDSQGRQLETYRLGANDHVIRDARRLAWVEYWLDDSFDHDSISIFNPCGTNFQPDTNFVFNFQAMIGYLLGQKNLPFQLKCKKPKGMIPATSLERLASSSRLDEFFAKNYDHLVDNPIMYSWNEPVSYMQGATKVSIAVFSLTGKVDAEMVRPILKPITDAVEKFFVKMPVDRYTFILYFCPIGATSMIRQEGFGALEHSYSSVYFLPEPGGSVSFKELIQHTAAHEFIHILIPLNLHSHEIANFDFREPKMSRHLWLYEGVTEYFALLSLVQDSLMTENQFMDEIKKRIQSTELMYRRPVSLTELAVNVMSEEYQPLYPIIYEKGAVVAFLMDLKLRSLSNGATTLYNLVLRLSERFGPTRPFNDNELFNIIYTMTYPEIKPFVESNIIGEATPDYNAFLNKMGWNFARDTAVPKPSFGGVYVDTDSNGRVVLFARDTANQLGIRNRDLLEEIAGRSFAGEVDWDYLNATLLQPKTSEPLTIKVRRGAEVLELNGKPSMRTQRQMFYMWKSETPGPEAETLRRGLLQGDNN